MHMKLSCQGAAKEAEKAGIRDVLGKVTDFPDWHARQPLSFPSFTLRTSHCTRLSRIGVEPALTPSARGHTLAVLLPKGLRARGEDTS
jgi:hypothetical protein